MNKLKIARWTSQLFIESDIKIHSKDIDGILINIETNYSKFKTSRWTKGDYNLVDIRRVTGNDLSTKELESFTILPDGSRDATGLLKGFAIKRISNYLKDNGAKSFCISFGGDDLGYNYKAKIRISNKCYIDVNGNWCVFTSNNIGRPGHIQFRNAQVHPYNSVTVVLRNSQDPIKADYLATHCFATGDYWKGDGVSIIFTFNGVPTMQKQRGYCASPFFNPRQIRIRDAMVSNLANYFRPDLTENSKKFDVSNGDKSVAQAIFDDNINEIDYSDYLVFPRMTLDVGTLFEVGHAVRLNKLIIAYDHFDRSYTFIDGEAAKTKLPNITKKTIVRCNNQSTAILLGYNYTNRQNIYYDVEHLNDNIMLRFSFTRVVKTDVGYKIEKDFKNVA